MTVNAGDVLRATVTWLDINNSKVQNTWHFLVSGAGSAENADVFQAASFKLTYIYQNFTPKLSAEFVSDSLLLDEVSPTVGPWEVVQTVGLGQFIGGAVSGEDATNHPLPPSDAVMMRLNTLLRKHAGRKYYSGFCEDSNDSNGRVNALTVTAVAASSTDIMSSQAIANSTATLILVVPNMAGFATNQINATITQAIWRTQRRRQAGVGI